ncbi:MAG: DUF4011 domain-containing protein, partial [Thermoproteota archaeon]
MKSDADIAGKLEQARRSLLDMTLRNKLLNFRETRSSTIKIVDELPAEVYRILVKNKKEMSFKPKKEDTALLELEGEQQSTSIITPEPKHLDSILQTAHTKENLEKRLLRIAVNTRTVLEEQGVNILYLAIGFLEWYESDTSDEALRAPLILIPVEITRKNAISPFKIKYSGEDITTNLSLAEKLNQEFRIIMPEITEGNGEDFDPDNYLKDVESSVKFTSRWSVVRDIYLGLFSFGKLMMYRDLDPSKWPEGKSISSHPILTRILCDISDDMPPAIGENENIDKLLSPAESHLVVDADSSQVRAIVDVCAGRNMVVVGPPGTGKSQTITNIIAEALARDKTVLFVSEKMAALEVVKNRLDETGLGDACLELHSYKAKKTDVIAEIDRTLNRNRPAETIRDTAELTRVRNELNDFVDAVHAPVGKTGVTPFRAIGTIEKLRSIGADLEKVELPEPTSWTSEHYQIILEQVRSLTRQLEILGDPRLHPWRGLGLTVVLPSDREEIIGLCNKALNSLKELKENLDAAVTMLSCDQKDNLLFAEHITAVLKKLSSPPQGDLTRLSDPVWVSNMKEITELVDRGKIFAADMKALFKQIKEESFLCDLSLFAPIIKEIGAKRGRFFSREYRKAIKLLKAKLSVELPRKHEDRVDLINMWEIAQQHHRWLKSKDSLGVVAFGSLWKGPASDWPKLEKLVVWVAERAEEIAKKKMPSGALSVYSRAKISQIKDMAGKMSSASSAFTDSMVDLTKGLRLNHDEAFCGDYKNISFELIEKYLEKAISNPSEISDWIKYRNIREKCLGYKLNGVVDLAKEGKDPKFILNSFIYSFHEAVLREALAERPVIARFNGVEHERKIDAFRKLDNKCLEVNRQYLAAKHYEQIAALIRNSRSKSKMRIIENELRKKRRHKPIRKLIEEAGEALQQIKPCFMMSPMSIAQFLPPGSIEFDLVIFDEASQVRPEDALGAIARGKQLVVIGDSNQLPPTSFFNKITGLEDEDEECEEDIRDYESILEKCRFPRTCLRIHYRSRHHSLIQFSNNEFYRNELVLFPSPDNSYEYYGVRFHYVENGIYDRGRSRRNEVEARKVAEYVMKHARDFPDKSLGIGTFSIAQREAIEDALELLRREDTSCEAFFDLSKHEPFFVKNLENIQGDERDVIVLSVGYGKDANGHLTMTFGPLNKEGGWRRLNVLVTRARIRVEVFSSITYRDIDLSKTSARGVKVLKSYLEFAETGNLYYPRETQREIGSEFQAAVMEELVKHGLEIEPEVGVAGFFIDIGVKDPDHPGLYVLGIECDGATYHSARSARDRDRLRQQILEGLGWTIHRIWSVDWFNNREREIRKALEAYEKARAKAKRVPSNDKSYRYNPSNSMAMHRQEESRPALDLSNFNLTTPYIVTTVEDVFPKFI